MRKGYFITGTDTDCGKTAVACAILRGWQSPKPGLRHLNPLLPVLCPTPPITHSLTGTVLGINWLTVMLKHPAAQAVKIN